MFVEIIMSIFHTLAPSEGKTIPPEQFWLDLSRLWPGTLELQWFKKLLMVTSEVHFLICKVKLIILHRTPNLLVITEIYNYYFSVYTCIFFHDCMKTCCMPQSR